MSDDKKLGTGGLGGLPNIHRGRFENQCIVGCFDSLCQPCNPGETPCYPSKADLEKLRLKAQGKNWEI
jgi:hypothetical protein